MVEWWWNLPTLRFTTAGRLRDNLPETPPPVPPVLAVKVHPAPRALHDAAQG